MVELYQTKPIQVRAVKYTGTNETEIKRFIDAVVTSYPTIRNNVKVCISRDKIINFPLDVARKYTNYTGDDCFDSILKISFLKENFHNYSLELQQKYFYLMIIFDFFYNILLTNLSQYFF